MTQQEQIKAKAIEVVQSIYDPEIPVSIYELGLIYEISVSEELAISVTMTLTTPNCPVAESMPQEVQLKLAEIENVTDVDLRLTFEPPWNKEMMSEVAKFELGFD